MGAPCSCPSPPKLAPSQAAGQLGMRSHQGGPARGARSGDDGYVPYAFLAVTVLGAVAVALAYRPIRREPFTVISFALASLTSELALQNILWQMVATAFFIAFGALDAWA